MYFERMEPPSLLVARIADPKLPFGGTWTYRIAPAAGGSDLTITEDGEVYNVFFRFMSRFVFGHHATMDGFIKHLAGTHGMKKPKREEFVSTRSRIEKLGVKKGSDVLVLGIETDHVFMKELREAGARVRTSGAGAADMVFATFRHRDDLRRLAPAGAAAARGRRPLDPAAERIARSERIGDDAGRTGRRPGGRQGGQLLGRADGREVRHPGRETVSTSARRLSQLFRLKPGTQHEKDSLRVMADLNERLLNEIVDAVKELIRKETVDRLRDVYLIGDIEKDMAQGSDRAAARTGQRQPASPSLSTSTARAATSPTASRFTTSISHLVSTGIEVTIVVQGMAYSMGSVVLQAASPGRRLAYPALVDHDPRAGEVGRLAVDDGRGAAPRSAEADAEPDLPHHGGPIGQAAAADHPRHQADRFLSRRVEGEGVRPDRPDPGHRRSLPEREGENAAGDEAAETTPETRQPRSRFTGAPIMKPVAGAVSVSYGSAGQCVTSSPPWRW